MGNANRTNIESLTFFHDWLIVLLSSTSTLVFMKILYHRKFTDRTTVDSHSLETTWTILPILILSFLVIPSIYLLYIVEDLVADFSVKAIGHQWYWEYEPFESFLSKRQYRLLDTDHRLETVGVTNLLLSSADVLHSWTVPVMGVKADAVPGRLNLLSLSPKRSGLYYGQCREICGRNHSFMPITLECLTYA